MKKAKAKKRKAAYRNALALGMGNTVLVKLARLQFAAGRKSEAEQTAKRMKLVTTADCKMFLELWQAWGGVDRAWPALKKFLLKRENLLRQLEQVRIIGWIDVRGAEGIVSVRSPGNGHPDLCVPAVDR